MKALCVDGKNVNISIGKYYDIEPRVGYLGNKFCKLIDNEGHYIEVGMYRFRTIDEIREEKLKELGI